MRTMHLVLDRLNYGLSQLDQTFRHDLVTRPRQDQVEEAGLLNHVHNEQKKS